MSLLQSAMTLLLLLTGLGIFSHLSALILVFIARVNEVPHLILLPQVVVALDWLLISEQIPDQGAWRGSASWAAIVLGRAAPSADPGASHLRPRDSARVGAPG